jgi:mono/diheme cytochrome c family protein
MGLIKTLLVLVVVGLLGAAAFIWFGVYNVAADDPHWSSTYRVMDTLRTRSIATRVRSLKVPDLEDEALVRQGAGNYSSMCVTCHLAPGASDTELSLGLYPVPPTWSELGTTDPREAFWVIKHGVKMSGMPAWGKSMDDQYIWGMVAFLQRFPKMTAADYNALVALSDGHSHGGGETNVQGAKMPEDHGDMEGHDAMGRSSFEPPDDPMATPDEEPHVDDGHAH